MQLQKILGNTKITEMNNTDWIKEFDEEFSSGMGLRGYKEDIKQFISNLLKSRDQQLIEMIEGMRKVAIPGTKVLDKYMSDESQCYNQAIDDILTKIKNK